MSRNTPWIEIARQIVDGEGGGQLGAQQRNPLALGFLDKLGRWLHRAGHDETGPALTAQLGQNACALGGWTFGKVGDLGLSQDLDRHS